LLADLQCVLAENTIIRDLSDAEKNGKVSQDLRLVSFSMVHV
jgi:hypothetical protein